MSIFKYLKGVLRGMPKVRTINPGTKTRGSVLGKRKLDFNYYGFISSTSRPPLSSPKLEENSGVSKNERTEK